MADAFNTDYIKNIAAQIQEIVPAAINSLEKDNSTNVRSSSIKMLLRSLNKLQTEANALNKIQSKNTPFEPVVIFYNSLIDACNRGRPYISINVPLQELDRILVEMRSNLKPFMPLESGHSSSKAGISTSDEYAIVKSGIDTLMGTLAEAEDKLDLQKSNIEEISEFTKKGIAGIKSEISSTGEKVKEAIIELEEYIKEKKANLDAIENELSNQQGLLSGKMLAGGYAQQAEEERKSANSMRNASVLCLVTILTVVIYSLIELSGGEITVERSLVKLGLLLFLLAPAAYLARESTKHRNEHYALKQTALDLNAIGPFIASLDKDGQDLIKAKIAERLFCSTKDKPESNTFPINAHEVIIKLIEKFEPSTKPATDKTANKPQNE